MNRRGYVVVFAGVASILVVWKIASNVIGAEIILPSPERTVAEVFSVVSSPRFFASVLATTRRGIVGFLVSAGLGVVFGIAAGLSRSIGNGLRPSIVVIQSTPVMAVILLALIWFRTETVPVFVAFLMTFPIVFGNVRDGIGTVDPHLIEMARVYRVSRTRTLLSVYIPSVTPFFLAGMRTALALTWKVVIAAEILSQPRYGIGSEMNEARIFLITARVFAWTIIAISLAAVGDATMYAVSRAVTGRRAAISRKRLAEIDRG